jgi:pyruvate kinase
MKTKIIATYGPSIAQRDVLSKILKHVDVLRLNFSHQDEKAVQETLDNITSVAKSSGKEIALMADLPGPKIRLGMLKEPIKVAKGDILTLRYGKQAQGKVPLDFDICPYLRKGSVLYVGDGYLSLEVERLREGDIVCRSTGNGMLSARKGISIRNGEVTAAPPTEQDIRLARFAKENGFDYIAMSFVMSAQNIREMRSRVGDCYIISKIKRAQAMANIDEIALESDALMVARGDLAFEVGVEMVPTMQARIVRAALRFHRPVIVATQMLVSMVNNPMPTRAEVSDISSAVLGGADCLMLSEETAVGKYPVEAVQTMATTARNAEEQAAQDVSFTPTSAQEGIAYAAKELADSYNTDCIFVPTESGRTAMSLSAMRPRSSIMALSRHAGVRRKLALYYGVRVGEIGDYDSSDRMFGLVAEIAKRNGIKKYMVLSGTPHKIGSTDTLKYFGSNG